MTHIILVIDNESEILRDVFIEKVKSYFRIAQWIVIEWESFVKQSMLECNHSRIFQLGLFMWSF